MDPYSPLLALALAAGAGGLAAALGARWPRLSAGAAGRLAWTARAAGAAALLLLVAAVAGHVAFGHRPGTGQALAPGAFVAEHPAVAGEALLAAAALAAAPRPGRRRQ